MGDSVTRRDALPAPGQLTHGVDCRALGAGLYDLMSEHDQQIVAVGMIPKLIIDAVMARVRARLGEICAAQLGFVADDAPRVEKCLKPEVMREVEHGIACGIYARASALGKMIV